MIKHVIGTMKDFAQYDSRWAKLGYKTAPNYIMQRNGCGPTSCSDVIASHPNHRDYMPTDARVWMISHGYATNGHGTVHAGIPAILKAHGFSVKYQSKMSDVFQEMSKGKRRAIFLMNNRKAPNGTIWTSNGHFVACSGYKYDGKDHWFYICDPGGRRHDGWFRYSSSMKGCIVKVWTCYVPSTTIVIPTLPKRGYFKQGDKGLQVKRLQKMLNRAGYKCGDEYGEIGNKTVTAWMNFKKDNHLNKPMRFGEKSLNLLSKKLNL